MILTRLFWVSFVHGKFFRAFIIMLESMMAPRASNVAWDFGAYSFQDLMFDSSGINFGELV